MTSDPPLTVPLGQGHPLLEARFVRRPVQLVVEIELPDHPAPVRAHMPDRGRLTGILVPGRRLLVAHRPEPGRKTRYQAVAAILEGGRLASLDTHLPNRLIRRALDAHALPELGPYDSWRAEVRCGDSRLDFELQRPDPPRRLLLEIKSAGDVTPGGAARFPDAPTTRGLRHVEELIALHRHEEHTDCAVLFVAQGAGAQYFEPNEEIDPALAEALRRAQQAGVGVFARACPLTRQGLTLGPALEVRL